MCILPRSHGHLSIDVEYHNPTGESLSWYGETTFDTAFAQPASFAVFSVDGGTPTQFSLEPPGGLPHNHRLFFTTGPLESKRHTLEVVHHGDASQNALYLMFVIITNGNATLHISPPPTSPYIEQTTNTPSPSKGVSTGAISGIAIGGIFGVLLVVTLLNFWCRKRRKRPARPNTRVLEPGASDGASRNSLDTSEIHIGLALNSTNLITHGEEYPPVGRAQAPFRVSPIGTLSNTSVSRQTSTPTVPPPVVRMRHQDSGIRLTSPVVEDLPPEYTPT